MGVCARSFFLLHFHIALVQRIERKLKSFRRKLCVCVCLLLIFVQHSFLVDYEIRMDAAHAFITFEMPNKHVQQKLV